MELLLNLVWLLLAVPIAAVCRRGPVLGRGWHTRQYLHSLGLTICLLVVVFPVVSVSDDLGAVITEGEDPAGSGPGFKAETQYSSSSHPHVPQAWFGLPAVSGRPQLRFWGEVLPWAQARNEHVFSLPTGDRAPPVLGLKPL